MNMNEILKTLSHEKQMRFALFCALQVKHLMKDVRSLNALLNLELFIENKISKEEMKLVAIAANAAADDMFNDIIVTNAASAASAAAAAAAVGAYVSADAADAAATDYEVTYDAIYDDVASAASAAATTSKKNN